MLLYTFIINGLDLKYRGVVELPMRPLSTRQLLETKGLWCKQLAFIFV